MVLLGMVAPAIESRRLVGHPSACPASLCASDRLTRMRGGAEVGCNGSRRLARHGRPDQGSMYLRTAVIRYTGLTVGLMEIEKYIRYTPLPWG